MTFAESMNRLAKMAEKISDEHVSLEEAVACYEEGIRCYERCSRFLRRRSRRSNSTDRRPNKRLWTEAMTNTGILSTLI